MFPLVVACGTYDGSVFALRYDHCLIDDACPHTLVPIFVDPSAHNGCVGAVAVKNDVVLSGSCDEIIQIFSTYTRTRLGCLELHVGTIRQLEFTAEPFDSNFEHLFSTSDDGCIAIWRRNTSTVTSVRSAYPSAWECVRQLRRHKGAILSLAIHPSNRCAFSVSADKTFRMWNLLRGRQAYAARLKNLADGVQKLAVSPSGNYLLLIWPDRFDLICLNTALNATDEAAKSVIQSLGSVQFAQATTSAPVFFCEDDCVDHLSSKTRAVYILVGTGASLSLLRFDLKTSHKKEQLKVVSELRLPGKRVKFIQVLSWPSNLTKDCSTYAGRSRLVSVVTTDSEGSHIRGYAINLNELEVLTPGKSFTPVFTYDVSSRITSFSASWDDKMVETHGNNTCDQEDKIHDNC